MEKTNATNILCQANGNMSQLLLCSNWKKFGITNTVLCYPKIINFEWPEWPDPANTLEIKNLSHLNNNGDNSFLESGSQMHGCTIG